MDTGSPQFAYLFFIVTGLAVIGTFALIMLYNFLSDARSSPVESDYYDNRQEDNRTDNRTQTVYNVAGDLVINNYAAPAQVAPASLPTAQQPQPLFGRPRHAPAAYVVPQRSLPAPRDADPDLSVAPFDSVEWVENW